MENTRIDQLTIDRTTVSCDTDRRQENAMRARSIPTRIDAAARCLAGTVLAGALLLGATLLAAPEAAAQFDEICANRGDDDGDGMGSYAECNYGTDPRDPDTDHDGTSDPAEIKDHGTDPRNVDTDGDGLSDTFEIGLVPGPLVNNNAVPPADIVVDPAGRDDTDGDGLFDDDELYVYGTDPANADTDFDGVGDGEEVYLGTNPLD